MNDDLISRQAAIDALKNLTDLVGRNVFTKNGLHPWNVIAQLPSVTPKQRTGHWIESRCDMYVCSECENTYTDLSGERYGMNYCPNCGVKMEVEEKSCSNCKFWCLDKNDENRRCKYCYCQDEWQAESEDKE